jgi:hypothetical protein
MLDAARDEGVRILWFPVSASAVQHTELAAYQAITSPARPLDGLPRAAQNRALVEIAEAIVEAFSLTPPNAGQLPPDA